MLENQGDDVGMLGNIRQKVSMNDNRGLVDIGPAPRLGKNLIRTDAPGHFLGQIKTSEDLEFVIDDVFTAFIGCRNSLVIGTDLPRGSSFQHVADEKLGLGSIRSVPYQWHQ